MTQIRKIKIIRAFDNDTFQALLNQSLQNGWLPRYETFKISFSSIDNSYVILVEKNIDIDRPDMDGHDISKPEEEVK